MGGLPRFPHICALSSFAASKARSGAARRAPSERHRRRWGRDFHVSQWAEAQRRAPALDAQAFLGAELLVQQPGSQRSSETSSRSRRPPDRHQLFDRSLRSGAAHPRARAGRRDGTRLVGELEQPMNRKNSNGSGRQSPTVEGSREEAAFNPIQQAFVQGQAFQRASAPPLRPAEVETEGPMRDAAQRNR